jgi:tetratricopeptide (TPR) repeat protein
LRVVALDYVLLGDYADADSWLTKSLARNTKEPESWYYLGRIKYSENRWEEAIHAFERCLEFDAHNVKAESNLGLSYEAVGRTEEAFASYRRAIGWQTQAVKPSAEPFIELGRLLVEHDKAEEAIPYLRQAAQMSPEESRAHEQLGKAYSRLNRLEDATIEMERAVALVPDSSSLHFILGQVYRKRGMIEKAKQELERGAALRETKSPSAPKSLD